MADRQMMRLNELMTTLTGPQKRRGYDESLLHLPVTASEPVAHVYLRPGRQPWRKRIPQLADPALAYWIRAVMTAIMLGVAAGIG